MYITKNINIYIIYILCYNKKIVKNYEKYDKLLEKYKNTNK